MEIELGTKENISAPIESVNKIIEFITNKTEVYVVMVENSGRRKLIRNLKPTLCVISPLNKYYGYRLYGPDETYVGTMHFTNIKNGKEVKARLNMRMFTEYEEAIDGYNQMIEESKDIFKNIIVYRESLKIKK